MKYLIIFISLFIALPQIEGQSILTLQEAKQIALDNNYNAQMSQNNLILVENNTKLIKAGKKPTFGLNGGINGNLSNIVLKNFALPEQVEFYGVPSFTSNIAVAGNYLLYDSHKIKNQVSQNDARLRQAHLATKATDENIIFSVENIYINIIQLQERQKLLEESITISTKRKKRAEYAFEFGQGNKLNLLNANVDLNRDSLNFIKFKQGVANLKRNLNLLLNRDINTNYTVVLDQKTIQTALNLEGYSQSALDNNLQIQIARESLNISSFDKSINSSNLKPQVFANGSYGINYLNNEKPNLTDYMINDGLRLGVSATWTLGDGGRTKIKNENVDVNIQNQTLVLNQLQDQTKALIENAWDNYQNAILLNSLEQSNVQLAQENFERTQERFNQGQINSITFRQAQLNLLNAKLSEASSKYDVFLLELELNKLSGLLK